MRSKPPENSTAPRHNAGVPRREVLAMLAGLVRSQGPNHDPKYEKLPELAGRWFKKYDENPKIAARWYTLGAGVN